MTRGKQRLLDPEEVLHGVDTESAPGSGGVGERALRSGLITAEDLASCRREQAERLEEGCAVSLEQILLKRRLIRPKDVEGLKRWTGTVEEVAPLPETIGRYRILEEAGSGGAAKLYLAEDPVLRRPVAIKVLQSIDPLHVARFRREALVASSLDHPNIVKIHEAGEDQGRAFIVMQFIAGVPIHQRRLALKDAVAAVRKIAYALHYAHRREVLHRDVKPANILIDGSNEVFLVDFGLGRETHSGTLSVTGSVMGTPAYMSPEQARGDLSAMDARSDIYSLGATLYELVTGQPPFVGRTTFEVLESASRGEVEPLRKLNPDIPRELEMIILQSLSPEPDRRYETAAALGDDLGRFLVNEPVTAHPPGPVYRVHKTIRRNPATALACLLVLVMMGVSGWLLVRSADPAAAVRGADFWVYRDTLTAGWADWSWGVKSDYGATGCVAEGASAIHVRVEKDWGCLSIGSDSMPVSDPSKYAGVEFRVHGGAQSEILFVRLEGLQGALPSFQVGETEDRWKVVFVPMEHLNPSRLTFNRIDISSAQAGELWVDEVRLVGGVVDGGKGSAKSGETIR